jgi:hypothetical protein
MTIVITITVIVKTSQRQILRSREDVSRLNYGVNFKHVQSVKVTTSFWLHSFRYTMPSKVDWNLKQNDELAALIRHCLGQDKNEARLRCSSFRQNGLALQVMYRESYERLQNLLDGIHALLPTAAEPKTRRRNRAPLGFIAPVLQSVFGLATSDQVDTLADHVRQLAQLQSNTLKLTKNTTGRISSFMKTSNARMDGLAD